MLRTPKMVPKRRGTTRGHLKHLQQLMLIALRLDSQNRMEPGVGALKAYSVLQAGLGNRGR